MNLFEKALERLKRSARLGNEDAKEKLEEIGVTQTTVNSTATGNTRNELERCLRLTFEEHNLISGKQLAEKLINSGVQDIIPYLCLSAIYGTSEDWKNCEFYSIKGLQFDNNNFMLLNHAGVAMCEQGNSNGLTYLKKGAELGDTNCLNNFRYWQQRI